VCQHHFPELYKEKPKHDRFDEYVQASASKDQLIADIDGKNLAVIYDESQSLAANLRAYYGHGSRKRFSEYLKNQHTWVDAEQPLKLKPGEPTPTLTSGSRDFIINAISSGSQLFVAAMVYDAILEDKPKKVTIPDAVLSELDPNSGKVQQMAQLFIDFLEEGLANE
jgi:hypothetical protein